MEQQAQLATQRRDKILARGKSRLQQITGDVTAAPSLASSAALQNTALPTNTPNESLRTGNMASKKIPLNNNLDMVQEMTTSTTTAADKEQLPISRALGTDSIGPKWLGYNDVGPTNTSMRTRRKQNALTRVQRLSHALVESSLLRTMIAAMFSICIATTWDMEANSLSSSQLYTSCKKSWTEVTKNIWQTPQSIATCVQFIIATALQRTAFGTFIAKVPFLILLVIAEACVVCVVYISLRRTTTSAKSSLTESSVLKRFLLMMGNEQLFQRVMLVQDTMGAHLDAVAGFVVALVLYYSFPLLVH